MAVCLVAAVLLSRGAAAAEACPGDCDGDRAVAIDELITGVDAALASGIPAGCAHFDRDRDARISIDELLGAVRFALAGCPDTVVARGSCAAPEPSGLVPCSAGTLARAARCSNPRACLDDEPPAADLLAVGRTADGDFALVLDERRLAAVPIVFDATVAPGTLYRAIGSAPGENRTSPGWSGDPMNALARNARAQFVGREVHWVRIDPLSEATARLIDERGLEKFSNEAIQTVEAAVRQANAAESFAGATPAAAADRATEVARADPAVAQALEESIEPGVTLYVGSAIASAGSRAEFSVILIAAESVVASENLVFYDPSAPIAALPEGRPACAVNPAIRKNETTFSFQPAGCTAGFDCEAVKAFVVSLTDARPIADGAVLYTCEVELAAGLLAGDVLPLACSDAYYSGPNGPIPAPPAGCTDADVVVAVP